MAIFLLSSSFNIIKFFVQLYFGGFSPKYLLHYLLSHHKTFQIVPLFPYILLHNLYPKDNDRKNGKKELKLGLDVVGLKDQNSNNLALNNRNRLNKEIYRKELMNNSPVNQINVSNSTINIFNNREELK